MDSTRRHTLIALGAVALAGALPASEADAATREVIDTRINLALGKLYKNVPWAREVASRARAMLIMPRVVKGSFILGGAYGEGGLRLNEPPEPYSRTIEYYSVGEGSLGLQIGIQKTSHVLFFMTDAALKKFRSTSGWTIGADAEVTFPDAGLTGRLDSNTMQKPIIGVVFNQDGFAVGASLKGAKYSKIDR